MSPSDRGRMENTMTTSPRRRWSPRSLILTALAAVIALLSYSWAEISELAPHAPWASSEAEELAALSPSAREAVEALASGREAVTAAVLAETERSLAAAREAAVTKDLLARAGLWRSATLGTADRSWHVQLERDRRDGTISGTIAVAGSTLLGQAARVDGRIDGEKVSGVITDDSGRQVASFSGTAGEDGMAGTYTTVDGDSGEWRHGGLGW